MGDHCPNAVAALAGRRIDQPGSGTTRFPLRSIAIVEASLRHLFVEANVKLLVCSAACGADLLALRVAKSLGIDRLIVLPFNRRRFKEVSVVDRPGDWETIYESEIAEAERLNQLIELTDWHSDAQAFAAANNRILIESRSSGLEKRIAVAVWEGRRRGDGDATADLIDSAAQRGFEIRSVKTV